MSTDINNITPAGIYDRPPAMLQLPCLSIPFRQAAIRNMILMPLDHTDRLLCRLYIGDYAFALSQAHVSTNYLQMDTGVPQYQPPQ